MIRILRKHSKGIVIFVSLAFLSTILLSMAVSVLGLFGAPTP
jgi:hypothetical protein